MVKPLIIDTSAEYQPYSQLPIVEDLDDDSLSRDNDSPVKEARRSMPVQKKSSARPLLET